MKQTISNRLERLEQKNVRAGCGIVAPSEFEPGSWTAFFGGRCRDFPTMEEASDYLTEKGVDPVIIIDI